jgi:hypothetical protein
MSPIQARAGAGRQRVFPRIVIAGCGRTGPEFQDIADNGYEGLVLTRH